eukprot:scaffold244022_cov24-Tisochrysis_lutea.AAC.1
MDGTHCDKHDQHIPDPSQYRIMDVTQCDKHGLHILDPSQHSIMDGTHCVTNMDCTLQIPHNTVPWMRWLHANLSLGFHGHNRQNPDALFFSTSASFNYMNDPPSFLGMGRAPATALAYMNWIRGIQLDEGFKLLTSLRRCGPK